MRGGSHARIYELSSKGLLLLLRIPAARELLTRGSKVWLRHARILKHLASSSYDGIIDGGASIGEFAALARLACPRASLLCVEPHPPSAAVLRRRGFRVIEAALWDRAGQQTLVQPQDAVTSCTISEDAGSGAPSWAVETIRLDELPIAGDRLLVKLDLQGAEPRALEGATNLWHRCAALLLEVSYGESGTYESLRAMLAQRGYFEAATFNELEEGGRVLEADKLWLPPRERREANASSAEP